MADELDDHTIAEVARLADNITRAMTATVKANKELEKALAYHDHVKSNASATRVTNAKAKVDEAVAHEAEATAQAESLSMSIEKMLEERDNLVMVGAVFNV